MLSFYWILACLFAGVLTFLSPCVLPILPIVLSTSVGKDKLRPLWIVLGMVLSFTVLGISLNFLGSFLGVSPQAIRWIALGILIVAGLFFLFPAWSEKFFQPLIQRFGRAGESKAGVLGAMGIGASLGAVWTPCAGPIFAFVLSAALLQKEFTGSLVLFLAYAVGAGIPMLLTAYLGNRLLRKARWIAKFENKARRVTGAIMVAAAFFFSLGLDTRLIAALPVSFFDFSKVEAKIVRNLEGGDGKASDIQKHASNGILPILGTIPEIAGISGWINSTPLNGETLRGKVVLVDFWTYSCINCLRTLPYLKQWHEKYKDQGFVILGVHTPEFAFEKDANNVSRAVKDLGIQYPVALDNDYGTWRKFNNRYWPAHYLIDAEGRIRYTHFGEGEYERTEAAIRNLLEEKGVALRAGSITALPVEVDFSVIKSPETYLGYKRLDRFTSLESVNTDKHGKYTPPVKQALNTWSLEGDWRIEAERAVNLAAGNKLRFQFKARKLNLVLASQKPIQAVVRLDGKIVDELHAGKDVRDGQVLITEPRLYELLDLRDQPGEHLFEIEFPSTDAEIFAFTFG